MAPTKAGIANPGMVATIFAMPIRTPAEMKSCLVGLNFYYEYLTVLLCSNVLMYI